MPIEVVALWLAGFVILTIIGFAREEGAFLLLGGITAIIGGATAVLEFSSSLPLALVFIAIGILVIVAGIGQLLRE